MAAVFHLVYLSKAAEDISYTDIENILSSSRRNNKAANITGLLIFREGYFLQLLEGDKKNVQETLQRIEEDDRNSSVTVLVELKTDKRLFETWSMAFHDADIHSLNTSPMLDELFMMCMGPDRKLNKNLIIKVLDKFKETVPALRLNNI